VIWPEARFSYRDGGMSGHDISRLLITGASKHSNGDAWVVQREVLAAEEYVDLWRQDSAD
jgi:hypothetical protein